MTQLERRRGSRDGVGGSGEKRVGLGEGGDGLFWLSGSDEVSGAGEAGEGEAKAGLGLKSD